MKLFRVLLITTVLVEAWACGPRKLTVEAVIAQADTAVVDVRVFTDNQQHRLATGFVVDPQGLIVTSYQAIRDAERIEVTLSNGQKYPVQGIVDYSYSDTGSPDFALLKINPADDLPALPLGDDRKLKPGETVVTPGSPMAYAHRPSEGTFMQHRQLDSVSYLQITAPILPAPSGGPLLNLYGEVIGINTRSDDQDQHLTVALSVQYIKNSIASHGRDVRFTVGDVLALQKTRDIEQLERFFTAYEHPQKLFSMLYPRGWQSYEGNRWRYGTDPDTSYVQTSIFAPAGAYNPETGYLAGGIRVMFYRPPTGRVWQGILDRWPAAFKRRMLGTNSGFAFTDSASIELNQVPARLYRAIGRNETIREVELDHFIVAAQPNYLLSIELACPSSQANTYEDYYQVLLKSFRFGLDRGSLSQP